MTIASRCLYLSLDKMDRLYQMSAQKRIDFLLVLLSYALADIGRAELPDHDKQNCDHPDANRRSPQRCHSELWTERRKLLSPPLM